MNPFHLFNTRLICFLWKLSISGLPPTMRTAALPHPGLDNTLVRPSRDEATAPNMRKNSLNNDTINSVEIKH